ncbi:MAG: TM2 domain-containing protein [Lachnospiraceae bacterium]|nr:TM2 domain-containing protein [Lachnospiraceae bacterium]
MAKNYDVTGDQALNNAGFSNMDAEEKAIRAELDKYSTKNPVACILLSLLHCHYFYVGRPGRGVLCLCTANFLYIGWLIDMFLIVIGKFKDGNGRFVSPNRLKYEIMLKEYYERKAQ